MRRFVVRLRPSASSHLKKIEARISEEATPEIARRYVEAIVELCFALDGFPTRGTPRDDIRPGLRTLVFRRKVVIAYAVQGEEVAVLGVAWRGQDIGSLVAGAG